MAAGAAEFGVVVQPALLVLLVDSFEKVLLSSNALAGEAAACADLRDCEVPVLPAFSDADAPAVVGMLGADMRQEEQESRPGLLRDRSTDS